MRIFCDAHSNAPLVHALCRECAAQVLGVAQDGDLSVTAGPTAGAAPNEERGVKPHPCGGSKVLTSPRTQAMADLYCACERNGNMQHSKASGKRYIQHRLTQLHRSMTRRDQASSPFAFPFLFASFLHLFPLIID